MKSTFCLRRLSGAFLTWFMVAAAPIHGSAADASGPTVTGLRGLAQYSRAGGAYVSLKPGMSLQPGDIVRTATGSALDLDLGGVAGPIRLLQSTTLGLTTVSSGEILLDLKGGEVLGKLNQKSAGSRFRIEVPGGIAGIVEGDFRMNARGYLVMIKGTAIVVESNSTGEQSVHTLNGTVYYSPQERAVRPAPKELEREIRSQGKVKLPKK